MKKKDKKVWLYGIVIFVGLIIGVTAFAGVSFWDGVKHDLVQVLASQIGPPPIDLSDEVSLGATPGNQFTGNEMIFGGVQKLFDNQGMKKATSTLCSFKPVNNATTSLSRARFKIGIATSTVSTVVIATSTSAYGTTTTANLAIARVGANSGIDVSFVPAAGTNNMMIFPNEYLLFRTEQSDLGGYTYTGECYVEYDGFER